MGILRCRWEADWNGHRFTMHRNEVTKGFSLECDGRVLAERRWSLIGTGTLSTDLDSNGQAVRVEMKLPLSFRRSACELSVDGQPLEVRQIV